MKIFKKITLLAVITSFVAIVSCGGNDDAPAINRLVGTWSATNVLLDGVDVTTPSYSSTTAIFNADGSYVVQGGTPAFTATGGSWSTTAESGDNVTLNVDGVTMTAAFSNSNETVTISFTAPGTAIGARIADVSGLSGGYVFTFEKQ